MNENKNFEMNDAALNQVSGGVGDSAEFKLCPKCGGKIHKGSNGKWGVCILCTGAMDASQLDSFGENMQSM